MHQLRKPGQSQAHIDILFKKWENKKRQSYKTMFLRACQIVLWAFVSPKWKAL